MAKVTPLEGKQPKQPALDQLTSYDVTQLWSPVGNGIRYNPDDLVGRKGIGIYSRMLIDDQLKSTTEFKLASIIARGYEFVYEDDTKLSTDEQKARISVMNQIVKRMKGSFNEALENVATGREYGFSMTEKVLTEITIEGKTYTGINKLVLRNPSTFIFHSDPYGELIQIEQRVGAAKPLIIDPDIMIHYVHRPKWDQFYGRSELRSAYVWYYVKDQVVKMWPMYLEKFGAGFGVAKRINDQAPTTGSKEGQSLKDALSNIRQLTSIYLPFGVEFDLKFPASGDVYEKCITFCDLAMARSQLVPNLLGFSHTGQTGSYSQSQTQFEAFLWTTTSDATSLAECFNEQLWKPLGEINWGDGEYPCMRFKPASFEHLKWMLGTWTSLLGSGAVISSEEDERYLRKLLDMPERKPDEVLENPLAQKQAADASNSTISDGNRGSAIDGGEYARALKDIEDLKTRFAALAPSAITINTAGSAIAGTKSDGISTRLNTDPVVFPHEDLRGIPREVFDRAAERVHFGVIEKRTDSLALSHVQQFAQLIARAVRRALPDESMSALLDDDPSDIASLDLSSGDRGKLRRASLDMLNSAWAIGGTMAANEVDRARGTTVQATRERFTSLRDNAAAFFDAKSFRMAGDASDQVRKLMQGALSNGVKYGQSVTDVRKTIWDALVSKGYTTQEAVRGVESDEAVNSALDELWQDTEVGAAAYLNTLVRTNTFEALNEARFAEFTDPALSDFVLALRYAAVLDSSTTEICRELDQNVYKADSDIWDKYRPPNHYNCRSVLVPITAIDGWDGTESDAPTIEPQEGF